VKKAVDSDDMLVRFYEAFGARGNAEIRLAPGFTKAYLCDMMENELEALDITDNRVILPVKNFEIVTLKCKR